MILDRAAGRALEGRRLEEVACAKLAMFSALVHAAGVYEDGDSRDLPVAVLRRNAQPVGNGRDAHPRRV